MVFKNGVFEYILAENIVVKGNIAQIEQYFVWQQCFQMSSAPSTNKSVLSNWRVKMSYQGITDQGSQHNVLSNISLLIFELSQMPFLMWNFSRKKLLFYLKTIVLKFVKDGKNILKASIRFIWFDLYCIERCVLLTCLRFKSCHVTYLRIELYHYFKTFNWVVKDFKMLHFMQ